MRPAVLAIPTFGTDAILAPPAGEGNGIKPDILATPGQASQLSTDFDLREQFVASGNTVRDAMKWLIGTGLTVGPPQADIQQVAGMVARDLQLAQGGAVGGRHQVRYIDDTPWSLQTTFYPMSDVGKGAADLLRAIDMPDGVVAYLEETLRVAGWRDKIPVRAPDPTETAFFRLPGDSRPAAFKDHRTSCDESDKALRLTVTAYPADRNQFVLTSGDVPTETTHPAGVGAPGAKSQSMLAEMRADDDFTSPDLQCGVLASLAETSSPASHGSTGEL
jgi:hypothetical protein